MHFFAKVILRIAVCDMFLFWGRLRNDNCKVLRRGHSVGIALVRFLQFVIILNLVIP